MNYFEVAWVLFEPIRVTWPTSEEEKGRVSFCWHWFRRYRNDYVFDGGDDDDDDDDAGGGGGGGDDCQIVAMVGGGVDDKAEVLLLVPLPWSAFCAMCLTPTGSSWNMSYTFPLCKWSQSSYCQGKVTAACNTCKLVSTPRYPGISLLASFSPHVFSTIVWTCMCMDSRPADLFGVQFRVA